MTYQQMHYVVKISHETDIKQQKANKTTIMQQKQKARWKIFIKQLPQKSTYL